MKRSNLHSSLLALLCATALPAWANFTDNPDGTVTDNTTGLVWDKCSRGQTWDNSTPPGTCTGTAHTFTWQAALQEATAANNTSHRGKTDWRLPNRTELESLVDINAAGSPAIDTTAFPNTVSNMYWSSTSYAFGPTFVWTVFFLNGNTSTAVRANNFPVRLVRSEQLFGGFDSVPSYAITTTASPVAGGSVSCTPNPVSYGGSSNCTATVSTGYTFSGWGGACSGSDACTLSNVTATQSVTANFTLNTYAITTAANPAAGGTVTCTPNPVSHGSSSTCTATPNAGYTFTNWGGDCSGNGACSLSEVSAAKSVTANFTLNAVTPVPTLSQWVVALLAGLLGLAALGVVRRR